MNDFISIHSLRVEGDGGERFNVMLRTAFQSTPSVWRETRYTLSSPPCAPFQSTPSVWRETSSDMEMSRWRTFQSTPSVWRETRPRIVKKWIDPFQSTPSVWRETHKTPEIYRVCDISIHSLRVEGDESPEPFKLRIPISIHSLRVEGDT